MKKQTIAFSRNKLVCSLKEAQIPDGKRRQMLIVLRDELARFGYGLTNEALLYLSEEDIEEIMRDVVPEIYEIFHHGETFVPLYPGWPKQTADKTNEELLIERDLVYETSVEEFQKNNAWYEEGVMDKEHYNITRWIGRMTEEEFMEIPTNIMKSNASLAGNTKEELIWFLDNIKDLVIPERIPFKETLCIVSDRRPEVELKEINDVLKFGYYKMGVKDLSLKPVKKDTDLGRGHKIKNMAWRAGMKLSRKDRRDILGRIEKVYDRKGDNALVDAKSDYGHWILLNERLHSGDYSKTYPKAREFFERLLGNDKLADNFHSKLQNMYDNGEDIVEIAKFLSTRPGEFIRRFDSVIRRAYKSGKEAEVFGVFMSTTGLKNRNLLSLLDYYDKRANGAPRLVKMPNGCFFELPKIESFNEQIVGTISDYLFEMILDNISAKGEEESLFKGKKVWIDPECKNIPIPLDMRNIEAQGFNIISRGTSFDIPADKNFIRFFVHWTQPSGMHTDLDLHSVFLNEDGTKVSKVGYDTGLILPLTAAQNEAFAAHSGDVINRDGDCAEYVDIDINRCISAGYRYVTMDVVNYRTVGMNEFPIWFGYSYRDEVQCGDKKWVPNQVEFTQKTEKAGVRKAFAWLFDLVERKATLIDASLDNISTVVIDNQLKLIKYFTTEHKINCKVIADTYYLSRGAVLVENLDDIDVADENTILVKAEDICLDYTKTLTMLGE